MVLKVRKKKEKKKVPVFFSLSMPERNKFHLVQ